MFFLRRRATFEKRNCYSILNFSKGIFYIKSLLIFDFVAFEGAGFPAIIKAARGAILGPFCGPGVWGKYACMAAL